MNIIYSKTEIKDLEGIYADPELFNGDTESGKITVYTNDEAIKKAYESKGIEVLAISQPKRRARVTDANA
jgi:rRNA-processing protein FCF1